MFGRLYISILFIVLHLETFWTRLLSKTFIISSCRSVQLNGNVLKMLDDETLPTLREKPLSPGTSLGLPAFSYGFFVIQNAKAVACI